MYSSTVIRQTCFRPHLGKIVARDHAPQIPILALDELLKPLINKPGLPPLGELLEHDLLSLHDYFFLEESDQQLYVPLTVSPSQHHKHHPTTLRIGEANRQRNYQANKVYDEQVKFIQSTNSLDPLPQRPDILNLETLHLSELLLIMYQTLQGRVNLPGFENVIFEPDHRGVVLLTKSGAGKTTASLKAFCDTIGRTRSTETPYLAGLTACWLNLDAQLASSCTTHNLIEQLLIQTLRTGDLAQVPQPALSRQLRLHLQLGPPLLIFIDLNPVEEQQRQRYAEAILHFQRKYGAYGHRCIITLRSSSEHSGTMNILNTDQEKHFGFYDLQQTSVDIAKQYVRNYRNREEELYQKHFRQHQVKYKRHNVAAEMAYLEEHAASLQKFNHGIVSLPLFMHLVTTASPEFFAKKSSLSDLYTHVVDQQLDYNNQHYSHLIEQSGLGQEEGKQLIIIAMTRVALAMIARKSITTRLPLKTFRNILQQPNLDCDTRQPPAWLPSWKAAELKQCVYFSNNSRLKEKLTRDINPEVFLEFSLLYKDGNSVGFMHDSFIDYFAGYQFLFNTTYPLCDELNQDWRNRVLNTISKSPSDWARPIYFLIMKLAALDQEFNQRYTLELFAELFESCNSTDWLSLLEHFTAAASSVHNFHELATYIYTQRAWLNNNPTSISSFIHNHWIRHQTWHKKN